MSHASLWVGNDTLLQVGTTVNKLTNKETGSVISGATVTATVKTTTGGVVSGATGVTVSETTTSGLYTGTIGSSASISEGETYEVEVTADGGSDGKGFWTLTARGRERYQ